MAGLREITSFQRKCREDGSFLLDRMGAAGDGFQFVRGQRTAYYEGRFQVQGRRVHIFLYPDQAEFLVDGRWAHFQTPGFHDGEEFATGFVTALTETLRNEDAGG